MKGRDSRVLEAAADSFLATVRAPEAPSRLREFGARRVWARAESLGASEAGKAAGRAYRNPALLRRILVACLALVVAMSLSSTGAYAFSHGAQPDSSLYGVKIFFERARIALAASGLEDARLEVEYSRRRMKELESLVYRGSGKGADRWLREYLRNLEGAGAFLESNLSDEATSLSLRFHEELEAQVHRMKSLGKGGPAQLAQCLEEACRACDREKERMRLRCGMKGAGDGDCHGGQGGGWREEPGRPQGGEDSCLPEAQTDSAVDRRSCGATEDTVDQTSAYASSQSGGRANNGRPTEGDGAPDAPAHDRVSEGSSERDTPHGSRLLP